MKNYVTLLCCAISFLAASAQKNKNVVEAMMQLHTAMIQADSIALVHVTSTKLTYGHSGGKVENQQQFIHNIISGASNFERIDTSMVSVITHKKTAVIRHNLHGVTNDNNKPGEVNLKVMLVFVQHKRGWQLLARQAVK